MQIEDVQDAALSNAEVLQHFNEEWSKREDRVKQAQAKTKDNKVIVDKPASNYADMHKDAEVPALPNYAKYPDGAIRTLLSKLKKFGLTKAELIMILNLKPTDAITLDIIIEELDIRFPVSEAAGGDDGDDDSSADAMSEKQMEMLEIINQVLTTGDVDQGEAMEVDDGVDTQAAKSGK